MKIITVLGARPQFIKASAVSRVLRDMQGVEEILVHTGQHFDANMSDVFFEELGIESPRYHLGIHGGLHGAMTGRMLSGIEETLVKEKPDRVMVYGDTNSTLAGALAAAKLHIPVSHVEAGLRSFNRRMPEEINRVLADQLSDQLFASTETAARNLVNEGVDKGRIFEVGDVMYDAALMFSEIASTRKNILGEIGVDAGNYVLATLHRAENTDDPVRLKNLVDALETVAEKTPVILPLHPRTNEKLKQAGLSFNRVKILPPLGYLDMVRLESQASLIATDSGGVQKEAFFYRVPCVTLRDETEWVELIELGWNRLASPAQGNLAVIILAAIGTKGREAMPYGDGKSSRAIAEILTR